MKNTNNTFMNNLNRIEKMVFVVLFILFQIQLVYSQPNQWQQKVSYFMNIAMNVHTNQFKGVQKLKYTNNSPDTLKKVFYHLYWNAFQPNSMMDVRNRELMKLKTPFEGWSDVVNCRIVYLKPEEIGYQKVFSLKMNGIPQKYQIDETILEVFLSKPLLPNTTVIFEMEFEAQVPLQIRRSGRDNPQTGVRYSMSQWYPKMCEYDAFGWHPTPYVGREFYGVWGDFDVSISIDKKYIIGGTGYLQNTENIGYGYEKPGTKVSQPSGDRLTWHFKANSVHDFAWAADPGYKHLVRIVPNGPVIHVLCVNHKNVQSTDSTWNVLADAVVKVFPFIEKRFGLYPYKQFSVIQGGDGGMEYPMCTLVAGPSIGTTFHEMIHSWYYGMLATNESLDAWMDEGFTSYASNLVWDNYIYELVREYPENARFKNMYNYLKTQIPSHHADEYSSYFDLAKSGIEEPLCTHADHYNTKPAYEYAVYSKGAVFLEQLGYIVGATVRDKILLEYYKQWQFKHPNANDFFRIAEKMSGMQMDWYNEYWIHSTKKIDYAIDSVWEENSRTKIRMKMIGKVPMPIDLQINYQDGTKEWAYIPQYFMFGQKQPEDTTPRIIYEPWKWTNPTYTLEINRKLTEIKMLEIDPSKRMADINMANNKLILP